MLLALTLALSATSPAGSHMLTVPLFRDDGGLIANMAPGVGGIAGVVTVRNLRDEPIVMYLVYSQSDSTGDTTIQQAVGFTLGAYRVVGFRPVADDPVEDTGRGVPNMLPGLGGRGSLEIRWVGGAEMAGALIGRYQQISAANEFAHVLLPDTL